MTVEKITKKNSRVLPIIIVICTAVVLLAMVSGWVYTQKQSIAQKDRQLQQDKQLKEYEQEQLNKRNAADNQAKRLSKPSGVEYGF